MCFFRVGFCSDPMAELFIHELAADGDDKQLEIIFRVNGVKDINHHDSDFEGLTALHWAAKKGLLFILSNILLLCCC